MAWYTIRSLDVHGAIGNKTPITLLNHTVATGPTERSERENSSCS